LCLKFGILSLGERENLTTSRKTLDFRMKRRRISLALAAMAVSCALCAALWPHAREAGQLLSAQDDPAALADVQLNSALRNNQKIVADNIGEALARGDADLANSFVELARAKDISVADELSRKVADAVMEENSTSHLAKRFATGLVTGSADDVASLSGTVTGDLFVIGDVRDVVREGKHLAMGEETDRLVLGLATAGLAVTAATYFSVGGSLPVRAGLSLVKDARKVGRLGEGLAAWAGRSAREVVDAPALEQAVASSSVLRPGDSVSAIKAAFKAEKAGGLVRLAKDVGRVTEKAGPRGAMDTLKIAEGPKDVARAAKLAEAKGSQTRAILKILGRGALLLATGMFDLALWLFGALFAVFSVLCTIKSTTERATQAWLDRKKARRLRRQMAAAKEAAKKAAIAQAAVATAAA
jgi:ATP-dependent protease HslVU (ClpYQ) peptidase subunit